MLSSPRTGAPSPGQPGQEGTVLWALTGRLKANKKARASILSCMMNVSLALNLVQGKRCGRPPQQESGGGSSARQRVRRPARLRGWKGLARAFQPDQARGQGRQLDRDEGQAVLAGGRLAAAATGLAQTAELEGLRQEGRQQEEQSQASHGPEIRRGGKIPCTESPRVGRCLQRASWW